MTFTRKYEGVEFTHRLLWQVVEDQARLASERERDWFGPALVAMVFAFHAVEAYANFAGEHLAPDIWADERNYFRKQPYRGWQGKLRKLFELVEMDWAPDEPPLKTLLRLKALRDAIAHGKSQRFTHDSHPAPTDDGMPWLPTSDIRALVTPKGKLLETLNDVTHLMDEIHRRVAPHVDDPFFKASALHGPTAWIGSE